MCFIHLDLTFPPLSPKLLPQSLTSAFLSWTPPKNPICIIGYTVSLFNVTEGSEPYVYNTTTNTTSMAVPDLSQGAEYYFIVAGIDTGGRVGKSSALGERITLDGERIVEYRH